MGTRARSRLRGGRARRPAPHHPSPLRAGHRRGHPARRPRRCPSSLPRCVLRCSCASGAVRRSDRRALRSVGLAARSLPAAGERQCPGRGAGHLRRADRLFRCGQDVEQARPAARLHPQHRPASGHAMAYMREASPGQGYKPELIGIGLHQPGVLSASSTFAVVGDAHSHPAQRGRSPRSSPSRTWRARAVRSDAIAAALFTRGQGRQTRRPPRGQRAAAARGSTRWWPTSSTRSPDPAFRRS